MKKCIRFLIMSLLVLVMLTCSNVSFAYSQSVQTAWNGTCKNQFTTTNYTSKMADENWDVFWPYVYELTYTPALPSFLPKFHQIAPRTTSGHMMASFMNIQAQVLSLNLYPTSHRSYNHVRMVIKNPYGPNGPTLKSRGTFNGASS